MNLIVFDCDGTLWDLPYEEEDNYMKLSDSINKHYLKYKDNVLDIYYEKIKNPKNIMVILSNRTTDIEKLILSKLNKDKKIVFDYSLFRTDDRDKSNRLKNLINSLDNIKNVEFYDDKYKHRKSIKDLKQYFKTINIKTFDIK